MVTFCSFISILWSVESDARELLERLIAASLFEEISQLFAELVAHLDRVRHPPSPILQTNYYILHRDTWQSNLAKS
jgi:hypothetical protein